ncbi:hypothetical protein RKD47_004877 [Streptomyces albogriseolus]
MKPSTQLVQKPQATLKGMTTRSPSLSEVTPGPTSAMMPMFSWPKVMPGSAAVRPSYMCRSDPQIAVEVTRTITSFGCWIVGFSTSSTATSNGPLYTTAFMLRSPFGWCSAWCAVTPLPMARVTDIS